MAVLVFVLTLAAGAAAPSLEQRLDDAEKLMASGRLEDAARRYRELLPDTTSHAVVHAQALRALAAIENRLGQYRQALAHARDAAGLYGGLGRDGDRGRSLNLAGLALLYAGDYADALAEFRRAADAASAAADRDSEAESLSNLGNASFFLGRYDAAERAYERALGLADAAAAPWSPRRRRIVRLNQAALRQRLGQYQEALAAYQADAGDAALPPEEHAQALVNQGALFRRLGDPVKALRTYEAASTLFAGAQHADGELGALINRGIVLALDLGDLGAARQAFDEALQRAVRAGSQREALQARLYRGEASLRSGDLDAARTDFAAADADAARLGTPEEAWKALYGLGRIARRAGRDDEARRYLEQAIERIERVRDDLRLPSNRVDFFQDKRDVYDALIETRLGSATADEVFALVERSRARAWRDRLGLAAPVTLAEVQRRLPPDGALLAYWLSPVGAALVHVTAQSAGVQSIAVTEDGVTALVDAVARRADDWRVRAEALSRQLLPEGALAPSTRRLIIVPDGTLASVPFDVLPVGGAPLVTQAAVSLVPAASVVLRRPRPSGLLPPWAHTLAAFGDPLPSRHGDADGLPALPASAAEVRAVASELGGTAELYLGAANVKASLVAAGRPRPPLLHLATHAVIDPLVERSRIIFSPAAAGDESLFLREVYQLDLDGVDLAVLSACATERGRVVRGEGVQSFSRAVLAAGARSTVTTLWPVPDEVAATFMPLVYDALQRGVDRDEALRRAKLRLLASADERSHPFFWAGYVLTGDAGPVARAIRWHEAGAVLMLAAALLMLIVTWRRRRPA